MSNRAITIILTILVLAAGASAFFSPSSKSGVEKGNAVAAPVQTTAAAESVAKDEPYLADFKLGYADGFHEGVAGKDAASQTSMANSSRGYFDGFRQGFIAGQEQQALLRSQLCGEGQEVGVVPNAHSNQFSGAAPTSRAASATVLGDRYTTERREVDNGIGSSARKGLLIAGGAATGAGLGGAFGGRKGALIGAAIGGGTGTALALTKKPNRAFNKRVTTKSTLTKSLIGAGAGAAVGGLAGGKRGALSGAALGGGAGLLWSLLGK